MSKYKVRFHLGKGKHYRHFQITYPDGRRDFFNPEDNFILMRNARLYNNCKVAKKIYMGQNKTVCSWIVCDDIEVKGVLGYLFSSEEMPKGEGHTEIIYNPRNNPHWLENGQNVDSKDYELLYTVGNGVFVG